MDEENVEVWKEVVFFEREEISSTTEMIRLYYVFYLDFLDNQTSSLTCAPWNYKMQSIKQPCIINQRTCTTSFYQMANGPLDQAVQRRRFKKRKTEIRDKKRRRLSGQLGRALSLLPNYKHKLVLVAVKKTVEKLNTVHKVLTFRSWLKKPHKLKVDVNLSNFKPAMELNTPDSHSSPKIQNTSRCESNSFSFDHDWVHQQPFFNHQDHSKFLIFFPQAPCWICSLPLHVAAFRPKTSKARQPFSLERDNQIFLTWGRPKRGFCYI